jgi:hypothetical protein
MKKLLPMLTAVSLIFGVAPKSYAQKMAIALSEEIEASVSVSAPVKEELKRGIKERLVNSGKFEVVERKTSDLKQILEEQKLSSDRVARVDANDSKKAEFGKLKGIEYVVFVVLTQIKNGVEKDPYTALKAADRSFRNAGANVKIIHASTGKIEFDRNITASGTPSSTMGVLSVKIVDGIIDDLYPMKILERADKEVLINRGMEHGIKIGALYEAFAVRKVTDKDTQEALDVDYPVGKIKITSVSDKTARAALVSDSGINVGCILRRAPVTPAKKRVSPPKTGEESKDW